MKKFLAIFLVLTLLFSFAACNKDENPDIDNGTTESQVDEQSTAGEEDTTKKKPRPETTTAPPFENPNLTEPAELFKLVDVNEYEFKSGKPVTTPSTGVTMIAKRYELKNSTGNALSEKINTEGTEIALNETILKDFAANGWTVVSRKDINTAVQAGEDASVLLKNDQGKMTKLKVKNTASTSMAMGDCVITEIGIVKTITQETWAEFTVDGKAGTTSSSYADFVNAFGKPKNINVAEYYKGNDHTHTKATLLFEQTADNQTWTLSVTFEEKATGERELQSCIYSVK